MFRSIVLGFAVLVGATFSQNDTRPPVPKKAELVEAEKLVKDLFKAEFAKTKAADRSALAAKLLEQAADSKDDLKAKYVLLQESRDVAAKAGDCEAYLKAADELAASFELTVADARAGNIDLLAANVTGADHSRDVGQALLEAIDAAVGTGEFDAALKIAKAAEIPARKANVAILTAAIGLRVKSLPALKKDFEKIADAQKKLDATPTDAPANVLVGRFLCFVKNDWENGLPRLALGNDEGLRTAAEKDSKASTGSASDKVEAGDTWGKLGTDADALQKANIQARALHWYRESLAELTGLTKVRIEKRVEELVKATPAAAGESLAKWAAIRSAIKDGKLKEWNIVGGVFHQKTYREVPATGAVLVGFRFTTSANGKFPDFMQAIYRGAQGEFNGAAAGVVKPKTTAQVTKAKAGYAVGALFTRGLGGFDAVQPIFMKMTATGLDVNDSYKGTYIGGEGGGSGTLGGDGNYIVGIHGKIDAGNGHMQAISPVSLTSAATPATPKGKPK